MGWDSTNGNMLEKGNNNVVKLLVDDGVDNNKRSDDWDVANYLHKKFRYLWYQELWL